jgi:ribosome-binding protein aMBF1 (putative translation factor)
MTQKCCEKCKYKNKDGIKFCLFPNCTCHTKTNNQCEHHWESKGAFMKVCRKCGEIVKGIHDGVHKSTTQSWQERFDKEFWFLSDIKVTANWKEDKDKAEVLQEIYNNISKNVKKFIQQELDRQRQEMRESFGKVRLIAGWEKEYMNGYNQAIIDILEKIILEKL